MKHLTENTRTLLRQRGITATEQTTVSEVIDVLRDEYGVIVDIRYSPYSSLDPDWYGVVFVKSASVIVHKVPKSCDDYYEVADDAIAIATKYVQRSTS